MIDWLHELPVVWIGVVAFAGTALITAAIYFAVMKLAVGDRGAALKAVSPGMLPPMGITFALIVGFLAAGVWGDADQAEEAVNAEASALRSVVLLSDDLPAEAQTRLRALVRRHIEEAVSDEWPAMESQRAHLTTVPASLADALHLALGIAPRGEGQVIAQREIVASLERALDARRQRIIVSGSRINAVKWTGLLLLAVLTLLAIAFVHSGNRRTAAVAMGVYAAAVAVVLIMLASQDRPFTGQLGLDPDVLQEVSPRSL
jgi:Protein of unknown function (DUF4239)